MKHWHFYALAALLYAGCKSSDKATPASQATGAESKAGVAASQEVSDGTERASADGAIVKDKRSQYDLAKIIKVAEQLQDEDERADGFSDIIDDWRGKQFTWTVYYLKSFCPTADNCHVVPFDRGGKDKAIVQGWSPQLKLAGAEWDKIKAGCPDKAPQCLITFEGTLASFKLSTQELTALRFEDVKIVATDANL